MGVLSGAPGIQHDKALQRARRLLRDLQAEWAVGGQGSLDGATVARQRADVRERAAVRVGDHVLLDGFRYDAASESTRFARTRQILDRVEAGPHEDGVYLELLARQAASVELQLERLGDPAVDAALRRVLFGTTGEPRSHASSRLLGDVPVVVMSAGMVYAYYQVAKAVVLSWKRLPAPEGSGVSFSSRLEDTREVLDADDRPVQIVAETLLNWLYTGIARPQHSVAPPREHSLPLQLLITYAERFVLAHEYTHALADQLRLPAAAGDPPLELTGKDRELRADALATHVVALSAAGLDGVAPNVALQGALMGMEVHQMLERLLVLASGGAPLPASTTHPPFSDRAALLTQVYADRYADDDRLHVDGLLVAADTAEELWRRAEPRVVAELATGRPLHPVWNR